MASGLRATRDEDDPAVGASRRGDCARLTPFFDDPQKIRWAIHTTNSSNRLSCPAKVTGILRSFLADEAEVQRFFNWRSTIRQEVDDVLT